MHQLCPYFFRSHGKIARSQCIYAEGVVRVCIAAVHVGIRRTGDNHVRRVAAHKGGHCVPVCNIKAFHARHAHVRLHHAGMQQLFRQGAKLGAPARKAAAQLGAELAVCTGNQNLHTLPASLQ